MSLHNKLKNYNSGVDLDAIGNVFDESIEAAADLSEPLPGGLYKVSAVGALTKSSNGTPSYRLTMTVLEPEAFAGRRCWHDIWLTRQAAGMAKRDLLRLGISNMSQLEAESPLWTLEVRLGLEDDPQYGPKNRVRGLKVLESRVQEVDPFAAGSDSEGGAL